MNPTSSYPYQSQGPIDFSNLNFVSTKQIEVLNASGSLQSVQVIQEYHPVEVFWTITGIVFICITMLVFFTWAVSKKSKTFVEAFAKDGKMF